MRSLWIIVRRCDPRASALADRHYSRQTIGHREFMPPGRTLVMITPDELAVWGVVENLDPAGGVRWRCSIFRNECRALLSSDLIREATSITFEHWIDRYGSMPSVPLTTEIDPKKTRPKRDPGRCFLRAGWLKTHEARGLVVLRAP